MKPTCAVCNRPVDEFVVEQGWNPHVTKYIALCHGEREETELTSNTLVTATHLELGFAFSQRKLKDGA